jgi:hypothetical protein
MVQSELHKVRAVAHHAASLGQSDIVIVIADGRTGVGREMALGYLGGDEPALKEVVNNAAARSFDEPDVIYIPRVVFPSPRAAIVAYLQGQPVAAAVSRPAEEGWVHVLAVSGNDCFHCVAGLDVNDNQQQGVTRRATMKVTPSPDLKCKLRRMSRLWRSLGPRVLAGLQQDIEDAESGEFRALLGEVVPVVLPFVQLLARTGMLSARVRLGDVRDGWSLPCILVDAYASGALWLVGKAFAPEQAPAQE